AERERQQAARHAGGALVARLLLRDAKRRPLVRTLIAKLERFRKSQGKSRTPRNATLRKVGVSRRSAKPTGSAALARNPPQTYYVNASRTGLRRIISPLPFRPSRGRVGGRPRP